MAKYNLLYFLIFIVTITIYTFCGAAVDDIDFESQINFVFYNKTSNLPYFQSNSINDNLTDINNCRPNDKVAIIVHGWTESCETPWILDLIDNLRSYRGGCIICMNYYAYSKNTNYFTLVSQFEAIVQVLTNKLKHLINEGFHADNYYLFGFSFGGQLAIEAGRRFGSNEINAIDVCEPAGVGFDGNYTYSQMNPKLAAKNVQCIHTSADKGTLLRNCHQNWIMGECGYYQMAAGPPPLGSHGLCPYFYNSAFKHDFKSIVKPLRCGYPTTITTDRINEDFWDRDIQMGYMTNRNIRYSNQGIVLYANTYKEYPFNIDILKP